MSSDPIDVLNIPPDSTPAQLRLQILNAQEASQNQQFEDIIFENVSEQDDEELKKILKSLKQKVERMETHVEHLQEKLETRKQLRKKEAGLTNMTPEERAQHVIEEEERGDQDIPDLDVVFEYMLLLGSSATTNTNDLSQADFLNPDNELRKEAMFDQQVLQQTEYSFVEFTSAKNILETQPDSLDDVRHCELTGNSFNEKFTVTFDVLEPSMVMCNLNFQLGVRLRMALGFVLSKIQESCNILGFFQLLVHYARLKEQRDTTFERLMQKYDGKSISTELLSDSRLKFEGSREDGMCLILNWAIMVDTTDRLEANVRDHVKPHIMMEAIASDKWVEKDQRDVLGKVNENFIDLVKLRGVLKATEMFVNKALA